MPALQDRGERGQDQHPQVEEEQLRLREDVAGGSLSKNEHEESDEHSHQEEVCQKDQNVEERAPIPLGKNVCRSAHDRRGWFVIISAF